MRARFSFEIRGDKGPEEVFANLCKEQTNTGFDTLRGRADAPDLAAFQARLESLQVEDRRADEPWRGSASLLFPLDNLSQGGNPLEDLLCFVAGESSHVRGIARLRLCDLELPGELLSRLPGPRHGVEGIRAWLGVHHRPLLLGPLRPEVGLSPSEYAEVAYRAYVGGADMVKDDELLVDPPHCGLRERALLCTRAARRAEDKTGERKMFLLNAGADLSLLSTHLRVGERAGVDGFMLHPRLSPSVLGFAQARTGLPLLAHYESQTLFTRYEDTGIAFPLMVKLMRLSGADIVTFPRPNPRFDVSREEFVLNLRTCLQPVGSHRPALPMPTGGNTPEDAAECQGLTGSLDYGFVSGSAMFERSEGIQSGARHLRTALEALAVHPRPVTAEGTK